MQWSRFVLVDDRGPEGVERTDGSDASWEETIEGWHTDLDELKDTLDADALSFKLAEESTRSAVEVLAKHENVEEKTRQIEVEIRAVQDRLRSLASELQELRHSREERARRVREREDG